MAAETITAANVLPGTAAILIKATAGATITQGQVLALSSGLAVLCDNDSATAAVRQPVGIAVTSASSGQPVYYVNVDDDFTVGATLAAGATLWTSSTAGGITVTAADNSTGKYPATVGIMKSTTKARVRINYSDVIIA